MKRHTIRGKVQGMVLRISIAALIITSIVGIFSMLRIQQDGENALIDQMEKNLKNITIDKSGLADAKLGKFSEYINNFAIYINNIYSFPSSFVSRDVKPPLEENAGKFVLQRGFTDRSVKLEDVYRYISLFGNLEDVWAPVMKLNNGTITTIYAGAESGFLVSYDDQSEKSANGGNDIYYDHTQADWYKLAKEKGRTVFTDIYEDSFGRGLTISCASPFYDEKNKFAGVVCMDILIADLHSAIVEEVNLPEDSYAFLIDTKGKIIEPLEIDRASERTINDETQSEELANEIMSGETKISRYNGIYYAYTRIETTGWTFCVRQSESATLEPARNVQRNVILTMGMFFAAFIVIIAMVFIIARKFSERLTSPIIALGHDAEEISSGNLDYRAEIRSNDEVGDLAKSFNDMAASLKEYVQNLAHVTAEKERISAELDLATQIQADMLPRIFPPFPDRKEFDIYATMTPAKEVGGDFYDFFMIDDDHLALVMADVSGKGVPAALFMVIAKTLIKTRSQMGGSPSEILADVNRQLCEGNDADLFVTVWLGILEISTGHVVASNAGHEYPAIMKADGAYELLKTKQSPAVATMDGIKFRQNEFDLNPGDNLYIYTDGVAEATNSHEELYGTDRMIDALNQTIGMDAKNILLTMKKSVDDFTGEAPQFDDITMLSLRYFGKC